MCAKRLEVLRCFKALLRTSREVFSEDAEAIGKARDEIRRGFLANKDVSDAKEVDKLLKIGADVKLELETSVARAVWNAEKGCYELRLKEAHLTENAPWPPPPPPPRRSKKGGGKTDGDMASGGGTGGCCGGKIPI